MKDPTEKFWSVFKILTGTFTGNRPLGRPRHRWEDNIRMNLVEVGVTTRNRIWLKTGIIGELCKCGIQILGLISHGISLLILEQILKINVNT